MSDDDDALPDLGPCCICETRTDVRNLVMLDRPAPVPGTGWGCVVCGLPFDGAIAVVCDGCMDLVETGATPIFICVGYPRDAARALYTDLSDETFAHDDERHKADIE